MYGLLLESLASYIKERYGEDKWEEIRRAAAVDQTSFSTHQVYPENFIPRLSCKAVELLNITEQEFMGKLGESFVDFVAQYGYDRVLSVLGRHMRDFLNGLDNLHEYLKFSYPRMRAPSFFCENESSTGLTLHYRSRRRGFVHYTMGQIKQVGKVIYNRDVEIEVVKEEMVFDMHVVTFNLTFDNRAFSAVSSMDRDDQRLPLKASIFIEIFPFCILFGSDMIIRNIGNSLSHILPELIGQDVSHVFDLTRPLVEFKFVSILKRTNNIFELVSQKPLGSSIGDVDDDDDAHQTARKLHLKGQMLYMEEWKMIVFLGTPQMNDLDAMIRVGLYINDLSMHDFSRDLMMAGTQQSVELKLALDQEQQKSKKLEESMKKLDEEMKRTDELLYQMIPKLVADRLRKGENPIDTCQVFECVTILFSDVVTFTEICSRISPMEVVSMLNAMYSIFDRLTEQNGVYKVETIGDAYMAVGGAPVKDALHAARTCDMALDMIDAIQGLTDPSTGQHLRIRVGVHSGAVVAGVVGLKMPRYCLFGDTVNTASRMESTSEPMKIHISQTTHELLGAEYKTADRGEIVVKGKVKASEFAPPSSDFHRKQGHMKTYWLTGKRGRNVSSHHHHQHHQHQSRRMSIVPDDLQAAVAATLAATNRGYSPVTMDDVARRSLSGSCRNSPIPPHVSITGAQQQPASGAGDVHRRSIVDMEKDLQHSLDVHKLSPHAKSSLHNEVVKANASGGAINHLSVNIAAASHGAAVNGSCSPSPRLKSDNFDLRLVCPHGKPVVAPHSPKIPGSPLPTPTSPAAHVTWSFPGRNKVGCALPDVTPHNGSLKDQSDGINANRAQHQHQHQRQQYEDNRSDGMLASRIHSPHDNPAAYDRGAAALAMAAGFGGAGGDFCCPSFSMRPSRLVDSVGGVAHGAPDHHSVACSIL